MTLINRVRINPELIELELTFEQSVDFPISTLENLGFGIFPKKTVGL